MPSVASNTALVAPAFIATAKPWIDLAGIGADHVQADDAVVRVVDDELHQRALACCPTACGAAA